MRALDQLAAREPVRLYLSGVLAAAMAVLVTADVLDAADVPVYLALAAALLAVPGVELARSKVTSPATAKAQTAELARYAQGLALTRPTPGELSAGLRELAEHPELDSPARSVLIDAANDLDRGTPPLWVMSKLVTEALR